MIELLVVVAIIALLISILLPSLNRARAVARMIKCQSILKQFGNAHHMYANQADDYFVPLHIFGSGVVWHQWTQWRSIMGLQPGSPWLWPEGLVCPDVPSDRPVGNVHFNLGANATRLTNAAGAPHPQVLHVEAGMPWRDGDRNPQGTSVGRNRLIRMFRPKVRTPSSKLQTIDASWQHIQMPRANWQTGWDLFPDMNPQFGGGLADQTSYRHNEGANLLLLDGHAEYRPKNDVFSFNPDSSVNDVKNQNLWYVYK